MMALSKIPFSVFLLLMVPACAMNPSADSGTAPRVEEAAADDKVTCRREHVHDGSRIRSQICTTRESRKEMERAQQRMREGIRRMQDQAANARHNF